MELGHNLQDYGGADGIWGPATERAYQGYLLTEQGGWPLDDENALNVFYGKPNIDTQYAPRQTFIDDLPYPMFMTWGDRGQITRIQCHELVADSLRSILEDIASEFGPKTIKHHGLDQFGGVVSVRPKRGGSALSRHSWGIAIDLDPARNGLMTPTNQAYIPTRCPKVIDIFAKYGWISLGKRIGRDWMHFQATQ
ncbi:MAG: M15 family metallopeptidase [Deinococcota bacterium]